MRSRDSAYWQQRFKDLEAAQNKKAVTAVTDIERAYNRAIKDVESKIRVWYQRFADNNEITLAEAKKMLDKNALKEFKWDVKEYIKYGHENALDQGWMKELENASAKVHISRLQALELQIRQSLERVTAEQLGETTGVLEDVYKTGYYHTAYEIARGIGIGTDIGRIDQGTIDRLITKPWAPDGKNFSDRIWENKTKLLSTIHQELNRGILTGADPQKTIDSISQKMNVSKRNAGRLVMTEEAYFNSLSQGDMFKELDVEKYEIVATLDSHTSEICQDMDGKVFPMVDYEAGTTAPPFHVYCRSTTAPYFDENYGEVGERAARNDDDEQTYHVPADMKYKEWYDKYVEGDADDEKTVDVKDNNSGLKSGSDSDKIKVGESEKDAKTLEEAKTMLIDDVGFKMIEDSFKKVDDNLVISNANQLRKLEEKFGAIHNSTATICSESDKTAMAYVSTGKATPTNQNLSLCPKWYKDRVALIAEEKKSVGDFWSMPCALTDEELQIYTVTHEYGHILQNVLVRKRYELDGWDESKPFAFMDMKKSTSKAKFKWYTKRREEVLNSCYDEIIQIAKDKNPNFVLSDNLSRYGMKNKDEFFAETFANSQLSKPNELGDAMNVWLKRKGLMK